VAHKILEELFDSLLFAIGVLGVLVFFLMYWGNSFQIRYAEVILHDFLWKTSVTGKITKEDYEGLHRSLYAIDSQFDLEIQCIQYLEHPEYKVFSAMELGDYFKKRNNRAVILMEEYCPSITQLPENGLRYQDETNESLLATKNTEYLPLPYENSEPVITAVRPEQEVYVGEKLITLCKVISNNMAYYAEAPEVIATESGEIDLKLVIDGTMYKVPVQVVCHPRTIRCKNGHTVLNEKGIIEEQKQTGTILCEYCRLLPEQISCEISELHLKTKEKLTGENIGIQVCYLDGTTEYVTPESEDWKDNYDEEFCGNQEVTIKYRNAETKIVIVSENGNCIQCGKECNDRCAEDYVNYPYCLECLCKKQIFTGQVYTEESITYGKELLSVLDTEQEFVFARDDYILIKYSQGKCRTVVQKKVLIDGKTGKKE